MVFPNRPSNLLLRPHRVGCHRCSRDIEGFEQVGKRGNLVAFRIDLRLTQYDAALTRPGTHCVQCSQTIASAAASSFAVDGNRLYRRARARAGPGF